MQKLLNIFLALGVAIALVLALTPAKTETHKLGGASFYEAFPVQFGGGLTAGLSNQFLVSSSGCVQTYATSSLTKIKLVFSNTGATSTFNGTAYWTYGTCP